MEQPQLAVPENLGDLDQPQQTPPDINIPRPTVQNMQGTQGHPPPPQLQYLMGTAEEGYQFQYQGPQAQEQSRPIPPPPQMVQQFHCGHSHPHPPPPQIMAQNIPIPRATAPMVPMAMGYPRGYPGHYPGYYTTGQQHFQQQHCQQMPGPGRNQMTFSHTCQHQHDRSQRYYPRVTHQQAAHHQYYSLQSVDSAAAFGYPLPHPQYPPEYMQMQMMHQQNVTGHYGQQAQSQTQQMQCHVQPPPGVVTQGTQASGSRSATPDPNENFVGPPAPKQKKKKVMKVMNPFTEKVQPPDLTPEELEAILYPSNRRAGVEFFQKVSRSNYEGAYMVAQSPSVPEYLDVPDNRTVTLTRDGRNSVPQPEPEVDLRLSGVLFAFDELALKNQSLEALVKSLTLKLENAKEREEILQTKILGVEEENAFLKSELTGGQEIGTNIFETLDLLEENKALKFEQLELTVKLQMRKMWERISLDMKKKQAEVEAEDELSASSEQ